jgi:hypothetical protein
MKKRKLGFESLEGRKVCAGDVSVSIAGDFLQITGDDAANYVDISQTTSGGVTKFVVTGKAFNGTFTAAGEPVLTGAATTINGEPGPFSGTASIINIALNKGNDAVVLHGTATAPLTAKELYLNAGLGSDYARLTNVKTIGSTNISTLDLTQAGGYSGPGLSEAGNDKLVVNGLTLATAGLSAATGGGADKIVASNVHATGANAYVYLYAGNGADHLSVTNSTFKKVSVYMGTAPDKDTVTLKGVTTNEASVYLGAGNGDLLDLISDVHVKTKTTLDGGAGSGDTLKVGSSVTAAGRNITGFETKPFGL